MRWATLHESRELQHGQAPYSVLQGILLFPIDLPIPHGFPCLQNLSYQRRTNLWDDILRNAEREQIVYVAENEGQEIVGFVGGGPDREHNPPYEAELYTIYVLVRG